MPRSVWQFWRRSSRICCDLLKGDETPQAEQYASTCRDKPEPSSLYSRLRYIPVDIARKAGPCTGVPVAIKDIIATADMPTTNGSPVTRIAFPTPMLGSSNGLRNLGATIFGKNCFDGICWRHPGPTSIMESKTHAGRFVIRSAAAVAAGIVPLALGTQTLGSIIRPAASRVRGLKPSFGAILAPGVHPLALRSIMSILRALYLMT